MDGITFEEFKASQGPSSWRITGALAECIRSSWRPAAFFQKLPGFALTGDTTAEAIRQLEAGWLRNRDYLVKWKRSGVLLDDTVVLIDVEPARNDDRPSDDMRNAVLPLDGSRPLHVTLNARDSFGRQKQLGNVIKKCQHSRLPGDPSLPDHNILFGCADGFAIGALANSGFRITWEWQGDDSKHRSTRVEVSMKRHEIVFIEAPKDEDGSSATDSRS